ncbi:Thioredoxin [Evansella caseinilytica]|uniref:Thioredoxin n=1 Tax=Evansella caseinilytica TaxID=1503961 RepID=A0A1H3NJB5_9BACI|nr:thioredoxin family protein [Evansella caseinilytica]SDY88972.1 Thioredoxin [Evansella caseinilytica]
MKKIKHHRALQTMLDNDAKAVLLYFYTPLCGTCDLAAEFLAVIEKMEHLPAVVGLDVNYFKQEAAAWKIESVPCLAYYADGNVIDKLYAFESVTNVYAFILKARF